MDSSESFEKKLENLRVDAEKDSPSHEDQARAGSRASLDSDDASWVVLPNSLEKSSAFKIDGVSIYELWNVAYEKLRHENAELVTEYETELDDNMAAGLDRVPASTIGKRMEAILKNQMIEVNWDAWKLKFMSSERQIKDLVKPILGIVSLASGYVADGMSLSPCASLAWAGISVLLPLFVDLPKQGASLAKDLEYVSSLVHLSRTREELYIRRCEYDAACSDHISTSPSHDEYKAALVALYQCVLKFQAHSYCHFSRNAAFQLGLDTIQWDGWGQLINEIREQEIVFNHVAKTWSDKQYTAECLAAEKRRHETTERWFCIGTNTAGLQKAIEEARQDKESNDLIGWISSLDPSSSYNAALDKRALGTNKWLVEDNQGFRDWVKNPRSLLWLHGKVGSGKSILCSSVIQHLEHQSATDPSIAIAYFYFDNDEQEKQSVDEMLSSLIRQISARRPCISQVVKELSRYKHRGGRPATEALETALAATLRGFSAVYIVIDALDECPVLGGKREELLQTLRRVITISTMSENLHLFCTSRKEVGISVALDALLCNHSGIEINMAAYHDALDIDIRQYIDSALAGDGYSSWSEDVKAVVQEQLVKKADGMFQYANCQLDVLRNFSSATLIRKALDDLPAGLDATYDKMLLSIDKNFQPQVINSLKWLAFSFETFSISLLSEVFTPHPKPIHDFYEVERPSSSNHILQYFSGLLVVNDDSVRLAHPSIKDYLTSSRISHSPASAFSFTKSDAHLHIAKSCLVYHLQRNDPGDTSVPEDVNEDGEENTSKLAVYAARNWPLHLEMVPRSSWPLEVSRAANLALAIHSRSLYSMADTVLNPTFAFNDAWLNPLTYTASLGASQLTEMLISEGLDAYQYITQGDLDDALLSASSAGSLKTMQLLLDKGAGVDAKKAAVVHPLVEAAEGCHLEIVRFLLENEASASVLHVGGACSKAMDAAAREGNLEIVEFLVRHGTKVSNYTLKTVVTSHRDAAVSLECLRLLLDNIGGIRLEGALCKAALEGKWEAFELLLTRGADINGLDGRYGTPLHIACAAEDMDESRVEYLLDLGADPKIRGGQHGTALHAACYSYGGRDEKACITVAKLLIARGADVNEKGGEHGSALKNACASKGKGGICWFSMVELLLNNGARVNAKGGPYDNALQVACHRGNFDLVPLLLDWRAETNAKGGAFTTALRAACLTRPKEGNQADFDTVQLLLDHGADINETGKSVIGTALQAACSAGNMNLVRLLLDRGAKLDLESDRYGTALQTACQWGHAEIIRLLLDHGADVNILGRKVGGKFKTAIQAACSSGRCNAEIVHLLLDHGADIHAGGNFYGPLLHVAATSDVIQDDAVLKRILDLGADINEIDEDCGTALHGVLRALFTNKSTKPSRIRFLVEHGADINLAVGEFGSSLHYTCADPVQIYDQYTGERAAALLVEICPQTDVNAQGGTYGSALQAAAWSDQVETIKLLIRKGAHVNAHGGKYKSALNAAVFGGSWHIVKILRDNGAKPDLYWRDSPDEEWLAEIEKEDGKRAIERYRKFWEVEEKKSWKEKLCT
ncbi:hypothetical protein ACHAQJ_008258 [Trichoderma viride]